MTTTYVLANLGLMGKDAARFYLGDTDMTAAQLQDEEIVFALSLRQFFWGGVSLCARALSGKYSRLVNTSADGVSVQHSQRANAYAILANEYEAKQALFAVPYVGGISVSDMQAILSNSDRVPDIFRFCMFDDPPTDGTMMPNQPGGSNFAIGDEPQEFIP